MVDAQQERMKRLLDLHEPPEFAELFNRGMHIAIAAETHNDEPTLSKDNAICRTKVSDTLVGWQTQPSQLNALAFRILGLLIDEKFA